LLINMPATIQASEIGLEEVDRARRRKGWAKYESAWWQLANTSESTLKRFWSRKSIQQETFVAICRAVECDNWEAIAELSVSTTPSETFPTPHFSKKSAISLKS
jgi:hypothetical protein